MEDIGNKLIDIIRDISNRASYHDDSKIYNAYSFVIISFLKSISTYLRFIYRYDLFHNDIFLPLQSLQWQNKLFSNPDLEFIKSINLYDADIKEIIAIYCNIFKNNVVIIDDIKSIMLHFYSEKIAYEMEINDFIFPDLANRQMKIIKKIFNQDIIFSSEYYNLSLQISNFISCSENPDIIRNLMNILYIDKKWANVEKERYIKDSIKEKKLKISTKSNRLVRRHNKKNSKKKSIPNLLKSQVWDFHIGKEKNVAICYSCNIAEIFKNKFECIYKIKKSNRENNINNLRPVCYECKRSIGNMDLKDYKVFIDCITKPGKNKDISSNNYKLQCVKSNSQYKNISYDDTGEKKFDEYCHQIVSCDDIYSEWLDMYRYLSDKNKILISKIKNKFIFEEINI